MAIAARTYLLLGIFLIAGYIAVGGSHPIYESFGAFAGLAIVLGVAVNRPARRWAWLLLAASQLVLSAADFVYFTVDSGDPSFPSFADLLYLGGGVAFGAAVLALVGSRESFRREAMTFADAAALSLAVGLFLWSMFFSGALGAGTGLGRVVSIAYPVMGMLLLTVFVRVLLERGRRTTSYFLLAGAVVLIVVADAWYVVPALTGHYVAGTWRDAGWLGSYLLVGAAALDPSMRMMVDRRPGVLAVRRVVLLGSTLVFVAVSAVVTEAVGGQLDVYAFAGFGGAIAVFITVRVVGLVRTLEGTRKRAEESERRLRMIFERAPIGISVGREGLMSETNPALQRLLGYTGEELAQMHYTDVTNPDPGFDAVQAELDAGVRSAFAIDKQYIAKDGRIIDTHVHVALDVEDGLGIGLIEDVTERRELEAQLLQAQKMEAIGKLAGGIAHDFNNLMTAVIGYSDLLLRRADDSSVEKLEAIRDSAVRASNLTRQLLAFSRRQILQTDELDLRDVVRRMDGLLRRLIGEDVLLAVSYGEEPVVVRADSTQLEQVVMNLAVNARDAMPGGGTLTLEITAHGDEALLTVADTGVGIADDARARIFEPYFTTKSLTEASGLGLSTVHGIVGQSGGSVEVESALDQGTTFTIRLPLVAAASLPASPVAASLID